MPAGAVYVGRPTRYGNPFAGYGAAQAFRDWVAFRTATLTEAQAAYNADGFDVVILDDARAEETAAALDLLPLRGLDLVCWCALDKPCHADALLEFANR